MTAKRMTQKYIEAIKIIKDRSLSHTELYTELMEKGYRWNSVRCKWEKLNFTNNRKRPNITIRMELSLKEQIEIQSALNNETLTSWLIDACHQKLAKKNDDSKLKESSINEIKQILHDLTNYLTSPDDLSVVEKERFLQLLSFIENDFFNLKSSVNEIKNILHDMTDYKYYQ